MKKELIDIQTILLTIAENQITGNTKGERILLFNAIESLDKIIKKFK